MIALHDAPGQSKMFWMIRFWRLRPVEEFTDDASNVGPMQNDKGGHDRVQSADRGICAGIVLRFFFGSRTLFEGFNLQVWRSSSSVKALFMALSVSDPNVSSG